MPLSYALATVREAPFIVDVLRAADDLALEAMRDGGPRALSLLSGAIDDPDDELTAIAAVHAIGRIFDDDADGVLSGLLSHPRPFLREHSAWTLSSRLPRLDAIGRLVALVAGGGFPGMPAQRTLQHWARSAADHVALALEGALAGADDSASRARLAETLGLVPGDVAGRAVLQLACDETEADAVRIAAVAALADVATGTNGTGGAYAAGGAFAFGGAHAGAVGFSAERVLRETSTGDGELAAVARLALIDLHALADLHGGDLLGPVDLPGSVARPDLSSDPAPTIAQLFLHADIDRELTRAGAGDNGGVATLLLRLGDALAAQPQVGRVLTLSRSSASASAQALLTGSDWGGHLLAGVPLLQPPMGSAQAWPARVAAERGIRRALRVFGPVSAFHLRMADVGSMAAAAVAQDLGIPVVFTVAPDPHAVIHSLDMTGALTRAGFGRADEREHYWFRARLVQRLAANSAHNVLFPRPELDHDLRELLGIDRSAEPRRYTVVPEGIDLSVSDRAAAEVHPLPGDSPSASAPGGTPTHSRQEKVLPPISAAPAVQALADLIAARPASRHGLPLLMSVGRLHRVKGMASVVQAWTEDPALRSRCNLVIVGGDLAQPSADEQGQLDLIEALVASFPGAADGLILAGHQPNDVVARWFAAARSGAGPSTEAGPMIGAGGAYVCGSLKEEFGLAILEAMAAGLVVVAPGSGGPATYVRPGVSGLLVDTRSPTAIGAGMSAALNLAAAPGADQRAADTREFIRDHYTVQAMAQALAGVYAGITERAAR